MPTGCAAPMLVPGAITATCAARVIKTPAEPARAPEGEMYTTTGTVAASSALQMMRVVESRPPGVSISMISASSRVRFGVGQRRG